MSQKADTILHSTENEADAIVTLPGRVYMVINLTVIAGDCWHIRTMSDFNKKKLIFRDLHCLTINCMILLYFVN